MPIYEFRCEGAHEYELAVPMKNRDTDRACPECGATARRRISSPALGRLGSREAGLLESTSASAHEPAVVDRLPGTGTRTPSQSSPDPRHARLPRP